MNRVKELVQILNKANKAYYQEAKEIMTNKEYDDLYDELVSLEKSTGIVLANSPTQKVGHEVVSNLPKVEHETPMLSLDKTKDTEKLLEFLGNREGILSWKLDGLTVVLTYNKGQLESAVTRGNGIIGEEVTANAKTFKNIPLEIPYKEKLVIRGEAIIGYEDFKDINAPLALEEQYKNPRNLCSGSVRQLDSSVAAKRNIHFLCFNLVSIKEDLKTVKERFDWLTDSGFECVEHALVNSSNLLETVTEMTSRVSDNVFPCDGLVLTYNDYNYGTSLGNTSKFARHSFAFKWADTSTSTTLRNIEWQTSRTGLINPVAVFDPVELEGTTVTRATLNNLKFIEDLEIGIGDELTVYKANMIIPTIEDNLTRSNTLKIPDVCPDCGMPTEIVETKNSKVLICTNEDCPAKLIKKLTNFVKRDALDIQGLSEATLAILIQKGYVKTFVDLYNLDHYCTELQQLEGMGKRSVNKLLTSIEESKNVKLPNLIVGLSIPNIGRSQSKEIAKIAKTWNKFIEMLDSYDFTQIEGFGDEMNRSLKEWRNGSYISDKVEELVTLLNIEAPEEAGSNLLDGMTFVITGSLEYFSNRDGLKAVIEESGGKVSSSVSKNTTCLINNDIESSSSKNKKAKSLGVPIVTENDFLKQYLKK